MKILIDARLYGLENAGLGRYVMNLLAEQAKLDKKNSYIILLRKQYFKQLKFPKNFRKVLADFRHYGLSEQVKLPFIIAGEKADVVHFPHFNVPLAFKGKFIVTIHDIVMHKQKGAEATNLPLPLYFIKRVGYKKVFEKAVRDSTEVIVPSQFSKKELIDLYTISPEKITVTYEGVGKRELAKEKPETILAKHNLDNPYFIYVGNAYPHKNLKRAITAIVEYNLKSSERIMFAIVSSRSVFLERTKELIGKLGAKDFVKLLGFIPDGELNTIYTKSLGFIYPSTYEGFGLPGLEAMAAGTVALVSEIPVFKEIYQDKAIYFNPFDSNAVEHAIKDVVQMDKKKRQKMINDGKAFVKRYSWTKMARETLAVYNAVYKSV